MVSAEIAVALPALLVLLALALGVLTLAIDGIRCVDAARVGARAAARGDPGAEAARRAAPAGAAVAVGRQGDTVTVTVRAPRRPVTAWVPPGLHPAARAAAVVEQAGAP